MVPKIKVMLDSGAYSAWRKKETITISEYSSYLDRFHESISTVVNIDVIPGEFGKRPTSKEVEHSAELGFKNYIKLRKLGFNTLAVFHQGESIYWLEKYIGEGCDYIGISPSIDRAVSSREKWMDQCFAFLCANGGYPHIRTHGFGMTIPHLVQKYPWYTTDSATWLLQGGFGSSLIPSRNGHGEYDYTFIPTIVHMSNLTSPQATGTTKGYRNYHGLGPDAKRYVDDYLATIGMEADELMDNPYKRQEVNAHYYMEMARRKVIMPYRGLSQKIWGRHRTTKYGYEKPKWDTYAVVFAISTSNTHSAILERQEAYERLVSFYYFKKGNPFNLAEYARTGVIRPQIKRKKLIVALPIKRVRIRRRLTQ